MGLLCWENMRVRCLVKLPARVLPPQDPSTSSISGLRTLSVNPAGALSQVIPYCAHHVHSGRLTLLVVSVQYALTALCIPEASFMYKVLHSEQGAPGGRTYLIRQRDPTEIYSSCSASLAIAVMCYFAPTDRLALSSPGRTKLTGSTTAY